MPYLTREEVAMITGRAVRAEVVSPAVLVSQIGAAATGIVTSILTGFAGVTLDSLKPQVKAYLGRNMVLATNLKSIQLQDITDLVENTLNTDYANIVDLMKAGIGQGVGGVHASLYETLNGVNALTSSYVGMIQRVGIDPFISRWVNQKITPNIPDTETAWFLRRLGKLDDVQYNAFASMDGWDKGYLPLLNDAWTLPPPIGILIDLVRRGGFTIEDLKQQLRWYRFSEAMIDKVVALVVQAPEPYRIAEFNSKGLIDDAQAVGAFGWFGLDKGWAPVWKESQYQLPAVSTLAEMKWRELINDDVFNQGLIKSGIHPLFKDKFLELTKLIPPSQDLITMVVREAWEAANIVTAPPEFDEWMKKKGFSSYWNDKYWTAHFLPMPIQYGYANLQRGYWDKAQFLELLRIADIHPRWREGIYNVAFNPPSIREQGYGYDTGAYTQDDIVMYRRWGGLSEADAKKSAQALVDYRLDAERNALRTSNMNLYINNAISKEQFKAALVVLRTNAAAVELWLQRGDMMIQLKQTDTSVTEPKNITRSDVQWLFENNLRDEVWFKATLKTIGYTDVSIQSYLDQSKKRIQDKITPPPKVPVQVLNLSQMTNLYYAGIINDAGLTANIKGLGYDDDDTKAIVTLIKFNAPLPKTAPDLTISDIDSLYQFRYYDEKQLLEQYERRGYTHAESVLKTWLVILSVNIPLLRTQYGNAWIDEQTLYESISDLGIYEEHLYLSEARVNTIMSTIVKNTQAQRVASEKDLTKAEIIKGAKSGVLTTPQATQLLQQLGYSESEAQYLLAINKIIVAGDPQGYWQMRQATELYKKANGLPYVEIPNELIITEAQLKKAISELNAAKASKASEEDLGKLAVAVANIQSQISTIVSRLKIK